MALTQSQLVAEIADRAEVTRADAKAVLNALEDVVLEELGNAEKVKIGGLVQLAVRVRPATKARPGRNPATGEETARPLAKAKAALPSVQKAKRALGV
jgi:DNA-binding protein HU-beta